MILFAFGSPILLHHVTPLYFELLVLKFNNCVLIADDHQSNCLITNCSYASTQTLDYAWWLIDNVHASDVTKWWQNTAFQKLYYWNLLSHSIVIPEWYYTDNLWNIRSCHAALRKYIAKKTTEIKSPSKNTLQLYLEKKSHLPSIIIIFENKAGRLNQWNKAFILEQMQ